MWFVTEHCRTNKSMSRLSGPQWQCLDLILALLLSLRLLQLGTHTTAKQMFACLFSPSGT